MIANEFAHVDTWVFDLDNTLYHPSVDLFGQIEPLIARFIVAAIGIDFERADQLRSDYWRKYGTTLAGLMQEHDVDPTAYLDTVHDIDFSVLAPDPNLATAISALPGRKIVYTNGPAPYAGNVLNARGLGGVMDAVYGIEDAGYAPKPEAIAFQRVFAKAGVDPSTAAMFEDVTRNLKVPFAKSMRTIFVSDRPEPCEHVHYHTDNLTGFLSQLAR